MQCGEATKKNVELTGIIGGEHAREPVIRRVVDGETCLHASESGATTVKRLERAAKLIGLGLVLGVIDDRVSTARERQGDVKRPRLGARTNRRRDDNFEGQPEMEVEQGTVRGLIVDFEH